MLKKASGCVLTSLRGSTYMRQYASPLRSLRPCQKTFLNILKISGLPLAIRHQPYALSQMLMIPHESRGRQG
jgi:hypothetical protein